MKVLIFFQALIIISCVSQGQSHSPALQKRLEDAIPPNASASVPLYTFSMSEEERAEIEKYKNTPCGRSIGWVKGRDNVKLYKECEHDLLMKEIWRIIKIIGIIAGIVLFILLWIINLTAKKTR